MEKTIKLDSNTSIKLSNNAEWLLIYKDVSGEDFLETVFPAVISAARFAIAGLGEDDTVKLANLKNIDYDELVEALVSLSGIGTEQIINITWAMAKTADNSIAEPRLWLRELGIFPFDVIVPEVAKLIQKAHVTTKNWKWLQTEMKSLKPSL